jgi:hypothetical protein
MHTTYQNHVVRIQHIIGLFLKLVFMKRLILANILSRTATLSFQANTEKNKKVLSSVLIGWQLLQRPEIRFKIKDFNLSKMVLGFTGQESKLTC